MNQIKEGGKKGYDIQVFLKGVLTEKEGRFGWGGVKNERRE